MDYLLLVNSVGWCYEFHWPVWHRWRVCPPGYIDQSSSSGRGTPSPVESRYPGRHGQPWCHPTLSESHQIYKGRYSLFSHSLQVITFSLIFRIYNHLITISQYSATISSLALNIKPFPKCKIQSFFPSLIKQLIFFPHFSVKNVKVIYNCYNDCARIEIKLIRKTNKLLEN